MMNTLPELNSLSFKQPLQCLGKCLRALEITKPSQLLSVCVEKPDVRQTHHSKLSCQVGMLVGVNA